MWLEALPLLASHEALRTRWSMILEFVVDTYDVAGNAQSQERISEGLLPKFIELSVLDAQLFGGYRPRAEEARVKQS